MTKRAKSFKARHAKNIAKGKMSAAYWANRVSVVMSHNLFHFFSREAGQQRRRALDEAVGGLIEYLTPPNLRPVTEFVAQANPIQGMSDSMAASGVVFDPQQTAEARKRAALDMGMEMAFALTPAALAARGYLTPVQGVMEGLLGGSPAQKQLETI